MQATKTKKQPKKLIVNSLGEVFRNNEVIISDVNVSDIANRVLTRVQQDRWAKMPYPATKAWSAMEKLVQAGVTAEFRRQEREYLNARELKLVRRVSQLQKVNHDRFRVYGGIDKKEWINLITEFCYFQDAAGKPIRDKIKAAAKATGAVVRVLDKRTHRDRSGTKDKKNIANNRTIENKGKAGEQGYYWSTGPDHGRPEWQVELVWDVYKLSLPQLRRKIEQLEKATAEIWPLAGVSVI